MNKFFVGINCFPGNDKYKFKRLLVSLLMKPKLNFSSINQESEFIKDNIINIPDGTISEMVEYLKIKNFTLCESDVCVEFLVDGFDCFVDCKYSQNNNLITIIDEFKKFHKNTIISGTEKHTSLTINRNIFMKNHKTDYICFCDDDDISCSIDTKFELFNIYIKYIFTKIQKNSKCLIEILNRFFPNDDTKNLRNSINEIIICEKILNNDRKILELSNKFRKNCYDFLKNLNYVDKSKILINQNQTQKQTQNQKQKIKINPYKYSTQISKKLYYSFSFFGPHFFETYTQKNNSYNITYGFWSLIIPPYTIDNFTNIKEVKNEDIVYDVMHHLIRPNNCLCIVGTRPIYFYLSPSYNDYKTITENDNIASLGNAMMFGPNYHFKLPSSKYEYDSIINYCKILENGDLEKTCEFVADRDFRGYTIEDVKTFCNCENWVDVWNDLIKQQTDFLDSVF